MAAASVSSMVMRILLACILLATTAEAVIWGYDGIGGPSNWSSLSSTCGGQSQSPVNIKTGLNARSPRPIWQFYNLKPATMALENNGHSIVVSATYPANRSKPQIKIAADKIYELANVHFHWGKDDKDGSEHALLNKKYPLEMHAVHKRVINGVVQDEILVVGVMFDISPSNHRGLQRFINKVNEVITAETTYEMEPFKWSELIPEFNSEFYTYKGSLTTPPCSEVVTWVVRKKVEKVSRGQMKLFRLLKNDDGKQLEGNFRPVQPLYSRKIYYVVG